MMPAVDLGKPSRWGPANPVKNMPAATQAVATRPTQTHLEKRMAELEAEIARLKKR